MLFIGPLSEKQIHARRTPSFPVFLSVLLTAIALIYLSLPLLGRWLVREDPIHPANAIAVLAGRFPQRALEAARLYQDGYAPEVWLTRPKKHGFDYTSEDERNFEVLRNFGVPEASIHVLDLPIVNTADELNAIDHGLRERGEKSVIIVTSKAHTRRVFSLWDKYHAGDEEVLIHGVSNDAFAPSRWWRTPSSRAQGIHELLGMLNVWAGMPVHKPQRTTAAISLSAYFSTALV